MKMKNESGISWTQRTNNPVTGCTPVSPGCANCYAAKMARRLASIEKTAHMYKDTVTNKGHWTGQVCVNLDQLDKLKTKRPRRWFIGSMTDLFQQAVSDETLIHIFYMMVSNPQHTHMILTKRSDRMLSFVTANYNKLPQNIALGVSIENKHYMDRWDDLKQIPDIKRFISFEPLLGAVGTIPDPHLLDLAIIGGESGRRARPMQAEWVDEIIYQLPPSKVHFKQWGKHAPSDYQHKTSHNDTRLFKGVTYNGSIWI